MPLGRHQHRPVGVQDEQSEFVLDVIERPWVAALTAMLSPQASHLAAASPPIALTAGMSLCPWFLLTRLRFPLISASSLLIVIGCVPLACRLCPCPP